MTEDIYKVNCSDAVCHDLVRCRIYDWLWRIGVGWLLLAWVYVWACHVCLHICMQTAFAVLSDVLYAIFCSRIWLSERDDMPSRSGVFFIQAAVVSQMCFIIKYLKILFFLTFMGLRVCLYTRDGIYKKFKIEKNQQLLHVHCAHICLTFLIHIMKHVQFSNSPFPSNLRFSCVTVALDLWHNMYVLMW